MGACKQKDSETFYLCGPIFANRAVVTPGFVSEADRSREVEIEDREMKGLLLTLAIVAFSSVGVFAQGVGLEGIQWTLTSANGNEVTSALAYFEIDAGGRRFTGSTGCNRMFGNVNIRGQKITFSNIGSTKKMCKLPAGSVGENVFLNAMDRAARYSQSGNNLNIYDRRGRTILKFKRLVKMPPVEEPSGQISLEDRKWVLESIKNRKTLAPIKGAFISFDARKKSAGGDSGCNLFGGEYSATGSKIAIKDIVSTMRACIEDGRMMVEQEFFEGLRNANRYEIREDRLFLYRDQNLLLTLRGEAKG